MRTNFSQVFFFFWILLSNLHRSFRIVLIARIRFPVSSNSIVSQDLRATVFVALFAISNSFFIAHLSVAQISLQASSIGSSSTSSSTSSILPTSTCLSSVLLSLLSGWIAFESSSWIAVGSSLSIAQSSSSQVISVC